MMERDLVKLKSDYANAVVNSYKSQKGNSELVFTFCRPKILTRAIRG